MEQRMPNTQIDLGKKFFQYRDYTPIPLIILILWRADPNTLSVTLGILIALFGELFRIYSVAFIGKISRTRSDNTGNNLITSGPFSWVRNPLYVGNFFISVGLAIYSGSFAMTIATIALFSIQYYFIVQYEESILVQKFGQEYDDYREQVPAWIPKKMPTNIEWPDSFSDALESEKKTIMAIGAMILAIMLFS